MLKKIEALLLGGRWRRDQHAWGVWQGVEPLIPARFPGEWERMSMAGRVVRVYQRAHRGTKALVGAWRYPDAGIAPSAQAGKESRASRGRPKRHRPAPGAKLSRRWVDAMET
jgi:hypothetical protein